MIFNDDIDLLITGDFCIQDRARTLLAEGGRDKLLDMSPFNDYDYKITNLEGAFIDTGKETVKSGPSLQNPEFTVKDLKHFGFNLLCLANNHLMDFGEEGLHKTLEIAAKNNIPVVGAGKNLKDAALPYYIEKNGLKLAIINIAENEFGGASDSNPGFYGFDPIKIFYDLASLKKSADKVMVIFHGGHEHYPFPSPGMQKRYRYIIDAGADVVIAHHPHVFSGYEYYNGGFIAYSLGNFIFDRPGKRNDGWNTGMAIKVCFSIEKGFNFEIYPYKQCDENPEVKFFQGEQKEKFLDKIKEINEVIAESNKLQLHWNDHLIKAEKKYLTYLEVPNNRYIRGARFYRLVPAWLTKQHRALILNLMRCESHVEIIKSALHKSISGKR